MLKRTGYGEEVSFAIAILLYVATFDISSSLEGKYMAALVNTVPNTHKDMNVATPTNFFFVFLVI